MSASRPRAALPGYAELHCRSSFSFLTGASQPEELVERAQALGYAALAVTDECSLAGVVRAHVEARRCGLHLLVGAEMRLVLPGDERTPHARLVLLAQSRRGYGNLSHWITVARRRAPKGEYLAHPGDVEGRVPDAPMLAGLPECIALLVPAAAQPFEAVFAHAMWLKTWFGDRAYLALELLHRAGDAALADVAQRVSALSGVPVVAAGDVLMHLRSRKALQDVLTATRLKTPVAQCGFALEPNAEAHLRSRGRLAALYRPEWLARTLEIAGRCAFSLDSLRYEYPREIVPAGHTPASWLRRLSEEGAARRWPQGVPEAVRAQIEHELALVAQLGYEPYFLTVADIVQWARAQGILCQGRGSAANSTVCYCLGVTEVDPTRATLLFERFISAERNEPPDIDIDFEHQRREEVIQYIYRKYTRHRAALTAVVISYRPRSALRDVGRALGIDLDRIDAVAKSQQWFDGRRVDAERLRENGFDPEAPLVRLWAELTQALIGFPRHLSQHVGGFVIARDRLAELVPVENAAMPDRSVVQWDKDDLDALGLIKVDILALGMLSAIRRALEFIGAKLGRRFEMQDVPAEDAATYDMACRADTVGVFQIESRAQMSMLPRLAPRTFYDLVVQVAIVRPGPIQGGMVHPYLKRRSGLEPVEYPSGEIRQALERTLGVPIFQEQVMQLAILAADFTPGEADRLRRAMAAWKRRGGLGPFEQRLVGRMVEKGYTREYAERIFRQIEGFGEYGFPESHAASFALLAYVSSWIKRHHPDAFLAGLLNSQPMGFYAPAQLVRDARAHGVEVRPVDVRCSGWESTLEEGEAEAEQWGVLKGGEERAGVLEEGGARARAKAGVAEQESALEGVRALKRGEASGRSGGGASTGSARTVTDQQAVRPEPVEGRHQQPARPEPVEGADPQAARPESVEGRHQQPARPEPVEGADPQAARPEPVEGADPQPARPEPVEGADPQAARPEPVEGSPRSAAALAPAEPPPPGLRPVRLGFDRIHGFPQEAAERLVAARAQAPFESVEDLARRAALDARQLELLAQADALAGLSGHRHASAWAVKGIDTRATALLRETRVREEAPLALEAPSDADETLADYRATGLTLKQHPLALLRAQLAALRVQPAAVLRGYPDGRLARASGLVTHRQRPETAKGTIFVTLEDETGAVNVIVWPRVAEAQRKPLLAARLLSVYGRWQREGEVMHLVASKLVDHTHLLGGLAGRSRDFR